ncbi:hypothetical protein Hanom_Chr13g01224661 [Helianthus anomalus]
MNSSPVVDRPDPSNPEEDESPRSGNGGDGEPPFFEYEGSHAVGGLVRGDIDGGPIPKENDIGVDSHLHEEPQGVRGGCQNFIAPRNCHADNNNILFFKSSGDPARPIKKFSKYRPRKDNRVRNKSPSSDHRPRKRIRDDGDFVFDLNLKASEDVSKEVSGSCSSSNDSQTPVKVPSDPASYVANSDG